MLYANLPDDDDYYAVEHGDVIAPAGVDEGDDDNDVHHEADSDDSDYEPNQEEDHEENDSMGSSQDDDEDRDISNTDDTTCIDDNTDDYDHTHDLTFNTPGIPGMYDNNNVKIPGVNNNTNPVVETTGVDETAGVDDNDTSIEKNNTDDDTGTKESENIAIEMEDNERTYHAPGIQMKLRSQSRREYNVFDINESELNLPWEEREGIMLLQFDNSMDIDEHYINSIEAEWRFLTESLGWKAGLMRWENWNKHSQHGIQKL